MDVEGIKQRGKDMGLKIRRFKVFGTHGKMWMTIPASQMVVGDVWADHGLVMRRYVVPDSGFLDIAAGKPEPKLYTIEQTVPVRVFGDPR